MLKEHEAVLKKLMILGDLVIAGVAFWVAHSIRSSGLFVERESVEQIYSFSTYLGVLPFYIASWGVAMVMSGAYSTFRGRNLTSLLFSIIKAAIIATIFFGSYAYLAKLGHVSRLLIVISIWVAWTFYSIERIIILNALQELAKKGHNVRNMLIIGTGARAQSFIKLLGEHNEWGYRVAGLVDMEPELVGKEIAGHKVIGTLDQLKTILEHKVVDEVVFVVPRGWLRNIEDYILYCEMLGKRVSVAVDLFNLKFAKPTQRDFYDYPLLTFETTTDNFFQLMIKRFLDIVLSASAIVILSPLMLALAIIIRTSSQGPAIFSQVRCGLNRRKFKLYKFRTMVMDAEKKLEELKKNNEMTGPAFKMENDPRIIKPGKWIRKFSLDELPQFFNVLQGHMSIVGPRPPIPAEVVKYEPWQLRRLSMRPGLTCIWQVQGRNKIVKFEEWMKLDLQYIDTWSLGLDLRLFLKTIPIVIFGIGAK